MRHLLLLSVLLLGASWAVAQTDQVSPSSPSPSTPTQTSPAGDQTSPSTTTPDQSSASEASSDQTTVGTGNTSVQGCLSGTDGNYMLTDDKGTTYQLTGDTAKLSEHVGHEVKIMGTTGAASASGSSGSMGNNNTSQTLQVNSVKHISKTCKNNNMSH
ncbi:MAG TPA: hypothetical protein VK828_13815 [Terriglobales bacterium]|jgi:hypothetical protein|nr:hypothetical protein [Terriglobales bacterium]